MYSLFSIDLKNIKMYAHSKIVDNKRVKEPFCEHSERTMKYFNKLIEIYSIENIIDKTLSDIDNDNSIDKKKIIELIKEFIRLHDVGKLTENFQRKLDGENNNATHSDKSFLVLVYGLLKFKKKEQINGKEFIILFILLYSVYKHHGRLNDIFEDIQSFNGKISINYIKQILSACLGEKNISVEIINVMSNENFWERWNERETKELIKQLSTKSLSLFILLKLFHSLLIASDYYATLEYKTGEKMKIEVINKEIKDKILKNFHKTKKLNNEENYNVRINKIKNSIKTKNVESITDLNEIRSFLNVITEDSLEETLKSKPENNNFFLNIPTGGGKTNISMRLALKIMEKKNIKKIFYVFPFINIIEQSYNSLGKFIGQENMTRLDSRYIDDTDQENNDNNEKTFSRYIDSLFFNKPVLFLSHVKFFDMFFRNDKNSNYNFHQLANSVVIIDEIQAYKDSVWTEISYIFDAMSRFMNTHFIIMSATLPEIEKLSNSYFNKILSKDFTKKLFNHSVFKRTEIIPYKDLVCIRNNNVNYSRIIKQIEKNEINKILIVVNKVKDSYYLYNEINKNKEIKNNYKILLLNSTILDFRRKVILDLCKINDEKIVLISTQSVEAGVDIDFDIGFRAYAPLDSIIQVAGRINRNNRKDISKLYIFNDENSKIIYRGSVKAEITENMRENFFKGTKFNENMEIIEFYTKIVENIKADNETLFLESSETNISDIINLYLKQINQKVHLIDGDTISLFIPYDEEGKKLWEEYQFLFENDKSFENAIKIKQFRKKLAKYSINVFNSYTKHGKLKRILVNEIRYGYYFCENWSNYYNIESGLNTDKFKETIGSREYLFL